MEPNLTADQKAYADRAARDAVAAERRRCSPIIHKCLALGLDWSRYTDDADMTAAKLNADPAIQAAEKWKREYESNRHLRERMSAREYCESRARDESFVSLRWLPDSSATPASEPEPAAELPRPPIAGTTVTPHGIGSDDILFRG